jgi:predicted DNA repair protein MutK
MAAGLLALLDDIAMLADDVAVGAKVSTTKTAGILGDDLAVNAEKASGFDSNRELKVIWEIMKGSFKNKLIILPVIFLLSAFFPAAIGYILILGGMYLLYEGSEKIEEWIEHYILRRPEETHEELRASTSDNILEIEKKKIKAAIVTDFILSIEIIVIALGSIIQYPLMVQIITTTIVAMIVTVSVYGLVAAIVRIDNVGFWLIDKGRTDIGMAMVAFMPMLIKALTVIGTLAMVVVGAGILGHEIPAIHEATHFFSYGILNDLTLGGVVAVCLASIKLFIEGE